MSEQIKTMLGCVATDNIVHTVVRNGGSAEDCCVALVNERKRLLKKIMELELICPKKIRAGDRELIWHCPNHLVPCSDEISSQEEQK